MIFMTFHILGMSSSQLTNSYFSEGWLNHHTDSYGKCVIYSWFTYIIWLFSIAMLVYQRVTIKNDGIVMNSSCHHPNWRTPIFQRGSSHQPGIFIGTKIPWATNSNGQIRPGVSFQDLDLDLGELGGRSPVVMWTAGVFFTAGWKKGGTFMGKTVI